MGQLEIFLRTHGLWALFFAAAIEGDLTLLLTGMLIHLEVWPAFKALSVGALGALAGDLFYFWLGHGTTRHWLTSRHGRRVMPRLERVAKRYGVRSLFIARYIYGARVATMYFWGVRRLPYGEFLVLDALNCCLWVFVLGGLGYSFSNTLEAFLGEMRRVEFWLLAGLGVFFVMLAARHFLAERSRSQDESPEQAPTFKNPS